MSASRIELKTINSIVMELMIGVNQVAASSESIKMRMTLSSLKSRTIMEQFDEIIHEQKETLENMIILDNEAYKKLEKLIS